MLTISPVPCFLIMGATFCIILTTEKKFVSNCALNSSIETSSAVPHMPHPALFTSTSILCFSSMIVFTAFCTESSLSTSNSITLRGRFSSSAIFLITASFFKSLIVAYVKYPSLANASDVSYPIPLELPVTNATFSILYPLSISVIVLFLAL